MMKKSKFRWLLVAGVFFSQFFSQGQNWAFGIYGAAYCSSDVLGTGGQQRLCSLPGSLAVATWSISGLFVGRIADDPRVGFRKVALVGAIIWMLGYIIASFSRWYGLTVFAQGFMTGLGSSGVYFTGMSRISHFFDRQKDFRGAALGIAAAGVGVGGFVLAASVQAMISSLGIGWALRITGLIGGCVMIACSALLVPASRWDDEKRDLETSEKREIGTGETDKPAAVGEQLPENLSEQTNDVGLEKMDGSTKPVAVGEQLPEDLAKQTNEVSMETNELDQRQPNEQLDTSDRTKEPQNGNPETASDATATATTNAPATPPATPPAISSKPPLRDIILTPQFFLASAVVFFMPWGSMSPAYYGAQFAREKLGMSPSAAAFQVSILNISSTVGRVAQGILADYVGGPATNNFISILCSGLLQMVVWPQVRTPAQFSVYMVFQGLAGGSYNGVVGIGRTLALVSLFESNPIDFHRCRK